MTATVFVYTIPAAEMERLKALEFVDGLIGVWDLILVAAGERKLGERTESVRPSSYAIPRAQSEELLTAWIAAAAVDSRAHVPMQWVNVGPGSV
jgi:hypothetical protein